ncbi:plasmid mobilization relaxosome protein MobC [Salinivibrio sp. ML290]|uniref:plasmid mobilization relaxosome protein MobC n=1 Tax=Salinivibrio sp. ML290 TaxID=1909468 RepID=UPI0009C6C7DD|nr:hypothetical protein BZG23_00320 [Salinivibrio sp. ML290]
MLVGNNVNQLARYINHLAHGFAFGKFHHVFICHRLGLQITRKTRWSNRPSRQAGSEALS